MQQNDETGRQHTTPDASTRESEARQARMGADGGPEPTPDEESAAERNDPSPDVAAHEKEMVERGAHQQGEGRLP